MIAFGPVPSRRLGRSLGINNIPPKICTYSCLYCQVGRTHQMQTKRRAFYDPEDILKAAKDKVKRAEEIGESIDYLTFVPDGEPALDILLGREIELLKPLGIKIAVITNSSLIWQQDVREDLMQADWVSLKVDATEEEIWRKINRPHGALKLNFIMNGMLEFAKTYQGELVTETMLVKGLNDNDSQIEKMAQFLSRLKPTTAYIAIPTRPPAEKSIQPPDEEIINQVYQIFDEKIDCVEFLIAYEGNNFAFTGNVEEDLLNVTAVHPMRVEAVQRLLSKANADWSVVQQLIAKDQIVEIGYEGKRFFVRKFSKIR